ncbi:MAG: InlB B-repeat-containing protein [Coriobacteriales bacterium]|nr:InlB B-repeat-containing protein [Coriobacteriales bacterium]
MPQTAAYAVDEGQLSQVQPSQDGEGGFATLADATLADAAAELPDDPASYVEGEVIVVLAGEAPEAAETAAVEESVAELSGQGAEAVAVEVISEGPASDAAPAPGTAPAPDGPTVLVGLPADVPVEDALLQLANDESVAFVQPNYLYTLVDDVPGTGGGAADGSAGDLSPLATTIDDPFAQPTGTPGSGWWLQNVKAFDAWDLQKVEGSVAIAIFDTGIRLDHNDLKDNVLTSLAWDAVGEQPLAAVAGTGDIDTENGHGTHVAGIAAARANNGHLVAGVSYNAKILPVKVFCRNAENKLAGSTSDVVKAYDYVMARNADSAANVRVVNLSLGSSSPDTALHNKIVAAKSAGILTVASAGNDATKPENIGSDGNSLPNYPSDHPEVTAVTAVDRNNQRASFSQYNDAKDIAAPGVSIASTSGTGADNSVEKSGTSMAAPVVSGVAALLFAQDPTLTPAQAQQVLYGTAVDLGDPGKDTYYGHGLVDAYAALESLVEVIVTHTVTFDSQGGSSTPSSVTRDHDTEIGALPVVSRIGHSFLGWHTEAQDGTEVTAATTVTADVTYFAHWKANTYTVTFKDYNGIVDVQSVAYGAAATAPSVPPRTGYAFEAWDRPFSNVTSSFVVNARYKIRTCTVTFDANSADVASPSRERTYGSALGNLPTLTRAGYTFQGWYLTRTGGWQIAPTVTVTGDVTYYAHWEANTYTVTFKGYGNKVLGTPQKVGYGAAARAPAASSVPAPTGYRFASWDKSFVRVTSDLTVTAKYQKSIYTVTLNANGGKASITSAKRAYASALGRLPTPKRTGYTFQGWYTGKKLGQKVSATTRVTKNVTLYAHWEKSVYIVKLNANGGKVGKASTSSLKRTHGSKLVKLPVPKRTGYTFQGWYTGKKVGHKVVSTTKVTKGVTLYAHWKKL